MSARTTPDPNRRGTGGSLPARRRAGGRRAGAPARRRRRSLSLQLGSRGERRRRPGPGDFLPGLSRLVGLAWRSLVSELAVHHRREPAAGRVQAAQGPAMLSLEDRDLPDPADPHADLAAREAGERIREGLPRLPQAAAGGVPAPGAGGQRLRRDRCRTRHHAGRGPGALPSRREAVEGARADDHVHSLSDRMPEVARGASRWSAEDARHLETCADCRAEWKIVSATAGLGAALSILADPEATSDRVLRAAGSGRRAHPGSRPDFHGGRAGRRGRRRR